VSIASLHHAGHYFLLAVMGGPGTAIVPGPPCLRPGGCAIHFRHAATNAHEARPLRLAETCSRHKANATTLSPTSDGEGKTFRSTERFISLDIVGLAY